MKKKFLLKKYKQFEFLRNFEKKNILIIRFLQVNEKAFKMLQKTCFENDINFISFSNKHLKSFFHAENFLQNIFSSKIIFIYNKDNNLNFKEGQLSSLNDFLSKYKDSFGLLGLYKKGILYNTASTQLFLKKKEDILLFELYTTIFMLIFFQFLEFLKIEKENKENL